MMRLLRTPIFILCLLAFLFSVSYSFYFHVKPGVDARTYDDIGWNLAQGFGYRASLDAPPHLDQSIIYSGPGYELFLAVVYRAFGHRYEPVWIVQALFHALSALLVFLISRRVFRHQWSDGLGLVASAFIGFSPDLITNASMLLTENFAIVLLLAAAYFFFRYRESYSWTDFVAMLVAMIAGVSVRTPMIALLPLLFIFFCYHRRWLHGILFITIFVAAFTPWTLHNWRVYHAFIPFNSNAGIQLAVGNHVGATGEQEPLPIIGTYFNTLGVVAAERQLVRDALSCIVTHPVEFLKITAYRISLYFSFARPNAFWFHLHGGAKMATIVLSSLYAFFLFMFGFLGLIKISALSSSDRASARWLAVMLVLMPLAIVFVVVETRYRFLSYPFLALFAGYGAQEFFTGRASWKAAVLVFFVIFSNTVFDVVRNWERIVERIHGM
jgi:4-amino-4-deoxy-L-arabinose transferase-like glycosyltransferase